MNATATTGDSHESGGETRRDFLYLSAGAMAAVGTGAVLWPLIDSMNPAADLLAQATVEDDLGPIELGQRITGSWRGQPVFITHRKSEPIDQEQLDDGHELHDPATGRPRAT